ncbi:hypothetical protein [Novosphingopyxis baekryungensis]|uniref:hypothetical protein n=1 Tax=Novosphingopyxis baekryungensis TaxID=279369 RepID=UPI0012EB66D2|nr:hypothetical protein [Novosphingopyxis baekryungensis]
MFSTVKWILNLLLLASPMVAGCVSFNSHKSDRQVAPEAACLSWFEGRHATKMTEPGVFFAPNPSLGCFDGTIERKDAGSGSLALAEWASGPEQTGKMLVIRSHGGDAEVALTIAEDLQRQRSVVLAHELCASSCANYLFSGVPHRETTPNTLVLFHGGFSDQSRFRIESSLDRLYAEMGDKIPDPSADRQRLLDTFDNNRMRQDTLLRGAGVDPAIIYAVDATDTAMLPAKLCGEDTISSRNFVFFGDRDAARLGLAVSKGSLLNDPVIVNRRISELGRPFIACRLSFDEFTSLPKSR